MVETVLLSIERDAVVSSFFGKAARHTDQMRFCTASVGPARKEASPSYGVMNLITKLLH